MYRYSARHGRSRTRPLRARKVLAASTLGFILTTGSLAAVPAFAAVQNGSTQESSPSSETDAPATVSETASTDAELGATLTSTTEPASTEAPSESPADRTDRLGGQHR